jgi:hypothetical protein
MSHLSPLRSGASRRATALLFVPLAGLAIAASGCGGGSSNTASASTTPSTTTSGAAGPASFISCLESHGVPSSVASTSFGRGGFGRGSSATGGGAGAGSASGSGSGSSTTLNPVRARYASAFNACRSHLPGRFGGGRFQNSAAGKAYLNCLQTHGVTVPATPPSSTPTGPAGGSGFASMSQQPAYKAAAQACAALRPAFGGGATTTTTAG